MKKNRYEILKKHVNKVSLVSPTSQNWYSQNGDLIPWNSGSLYIGPETGDTVYNINVTGSLIESYYKWNGTTWISSSISDVFPSYNIPLFLESKVDEMGVMVGFDGDIEQVEQLCNFTYTGSTGNTIITIFNTVNRDKLKKIVEQNYDVDWGDGTITTGFTVSTGTTLNSITHQYTSGGTYNVSIILSAPWITQKITKKITVPFDYSVDSYLGTFTYTGTSLPYYNIDPVEYYLESGRTQNYLNDLEYNPTTGYTEFLYLGIGGSRIEEKRKYGSTSYSDVTLGTDSTGNYTGYSFTYTGNTTGTTIVNYRDYDDGYTLITGNTTGFTKEEIINQMITRNEHFLGFVEDPTVYSDIFVERGKQGVLEKTFRLGEIDNIGELNIYGNGYFKVRKQ
jgi:hypothetical protein